MTVSAEKRQEIITDVHESWDQLIQILESYRAEELEQPNVIGDWSLKDLISHVSTWDRITIEKIKHAETGEKVSWRVVGGESYRNLHQFNEATADANRHRTIEDLWSEMIATHQELLERIAETPVLSRDLIRVDSYGHYRAHVRDIRKWQSNA